MESHAVLMLALVVATSGNTTTSGTTAMAAATTAQDYESSAPIYHVIIAMAAVFASGLGLIYIFVKVLIVDQDEPDMELQSIRRRSARVGPHVGHPV